MLGDFLSCSKGVKDHFEVQEGRCDFPQDTAAQKGLITPGRENLLVFLELWQVPLELRWGPQGPACGASGRSSLHASSKQPLGIPLHSLMGPRSSSGVDTRTSGFLSSADMDLGVPIEFQQGSQFSSPMETCNSALLSSWKICVRLPGQLS